MKKSLLVGGVLVLLVLCYLAWGTIALDYGDRVATGTYDLAQNGETSTLVLAPDHTFQQELSRSGKVKHTQGTWRRFGEGGIEFSKEFLVLTGQELSAHGDIYADMRKRFGIFVTIALSDAHVEWYGRIDQSLGNSVSGTYVGDEEGSQTTLMLRPEQTFEQTVTYLSKTTHAVGRWKLGRNGEIVFSNDFLRASGESLSENETAVASGPRGSNLQIRIAATSLTRPPTFKKRYFRW